MFLPDRTLYQRRATRIVLVVFVDGGQTETGCSSQKARSCVSSGVSVWFLSDRRSSRWADAGAKQGKRYRVWIQYCGELQAAAWPILSAGNWVGPCLIDIAQGHRDGTWLFRPVTRPGARSGKLSLLIR